MQSLRQKPEVEGGNEKMKFLIKTKVAQKLLNTLLYD